MTPTSPTPTLEDALSWVLPMAKGYAAEHPVGNNAKNVAAAEAALQSRLTLPEPAGELVERLNSKAETAGLLRPLLKKAAAALAAAEQAAREKDARIAALEQAYQTAIDASYDRRKEAEAAKRRAVEDMRERCAVEASKLVREVWPKSETIAAAIRAIKP